MGGTRLYYTPKERKAQSIAWLDSKPVLAYKPTDVKLTARASSGLPVGYRVIEGNEWAEIREGGILHIHTVPEGITTLKVEAFQPGDKDWAIASLKI